MERYNPSIEQKWQKIWAKEGYYEPKSDLSLPKKYILSMFPYPSGALHMGHVRNYCISDAMARFYRMQGFNVLHPIGYDAFGMPAENAAIKHKVHPKKWTYENMDVMSKELDVLGLSFSKTRALATCDPEYTKFEQEFFIKMWEKGLVYRKKAYLNWCPNDQTVLANEQVIEKKCWRCDTEVVQKEMYQYYLKITDYAEELLADLDTLEGKWPNQVILMQKNWIGKSKGLEFNFKLDEDSKSLLGDNIESFSVYTTRPDTIFGVSYCALASTHPIVKKLLEVNALDAKTKDFITDMQNLSAKDSQKEEKLGCALPLFALHPLTGEKLPIWVANFVLMDYGSGAVMSVPAHDERDYEFALKYNLPIKKVILDPKTKDYASGVFTEDGILTDSKSFSGLDSATARAKIISYFEKENLGKGVTNYRLKDWGISRQRYWGAPIPLVHCEKCGVVSETRLPVTLPDDVVIDGEGNPLDKHPTWKFTTCPKCGGKAVRETDTMDTFVESSWYFLRYTTPPEKRAKAAFDEESLKYWMDVDEYIGGIEHAILHLLYARFFTKVLRDLGYVESSEPFSHLLTQGMVLKEGAKMSKSKGNIVEPNLLIEQYSADTARLFTLFAAPPTYALEWNDDGVNGSFKFLNRLWDKSVRVKHKTLPKIDQKSLSKEAKLARLKVYEALSKQLGIFNKEIAGYPFNVVIAACMEAHNALNAQENDEVYSEGYYVLLNILEPFVPHIAWELSQRLFDLKNLSKLEVCKEALEKDSITYAISINGKQRGTLDKPKGSPKDEVLKDAKEVVAKWLTNEIKKEIFVQDKIVNFVV
ncbi:leucine--tRNA ligase [Helicobacter sp. 13S00401-1]|uniref:leucine--tRNA ligase n=1 Tax=Helicobacter sp. 13S00401-1 TaxID=1905758 RepID=UPI000BA68E97|nr:leucine--tRNA ligase [Helicobacter sp. 13S00401-1]PAF50171.1 leucine--tRNA ligase [Helicobacter sp. 13S00401-1]